MPNNYTTATAHAEEEDEIDLRELFRTIGRYKWSIMLMTLIITVITAAIAYRMPKYYKTSTVIEVKPKAGESGGFSLGGAGALLGLGGLGGGSTSTEKDAALLGMFRINNKVLDSISYGAQFFAYEKYRYIELPESNCSIAITDLAIYDYKKFGMHISFEPINQEKFTLTIPSTFGDEILGEFQYNQPIHTQYFDMVVHPAAQGATPEKIVLNSDQHYIFNQIISKNLSAEVDKTNPFITVSYLDTLPERGANYIKQLITNYIEISVGFEIEDADITLNSLNKQILEIEEKVKQNSEEMQRFKTDKKIIAPEAQAEVLIKGQAETTQLMIQNRYQLDLIKHLIVFANKNKNIDAIAPSLIEFKDEPTIMLIAKLQELQLEASTLSQEFKAAYPKLKSTRNQVRTIKKKIKSNLQNLQKTLQSRAKSLKKLLKEYENKLAQAPSAAEEMRSILRTYTFDEKLYAYLLQKRSAAQIKKAEAMSRFRTIEPIYTNPAPAKPKKALIVIVGFITALILSIFLAFFREFLKSES
jgi:uncharacterized protein involved in exopolysaccharide biosynthesis